MSEQRFFPGDVVIGDYAWGPPVYTPRPVIRINRDTVTVGIHRDQGGWLTTERIAWADLRGVFPAELGANTRTAADVASAVERVQHGYLSREQRDRLGALVRLVATSPGVPTPIVAAAASVVAELRWDRAGEQ